MIFVNFFGLDFKEWGRYPFFNLARMWKLFLFNISYWWIKHLIFWWGRPKAKLEKACKLTYLELFNKEIFSAFRWSLDRKTEATTHTAVLVISYDLFDNLYRNSITEECLLIWQHCDSLMPLRYLWLNFISSFVFLLLPSLC